MPEPTSIQSQETKDLDILNEVPSRLFRYGNILVAGFVLSLIFLGFIIRYPDILQARITITTQEPPARVVANRTGKLIEIRVSEGSKVKADQILGILESNANYKDILTLKNELEKYNHRIQEGVFPPTSSWPRNLNIGLISNDYASFLSSLFTYERLNKFSVSLNRIRSERNKIRELISFRNTLEDQVENLNQELKLLENDAERDRKLYSENVISKKQLEEKERQLLVLKRQLQNVMLDLDNVDIQLLESERYISEFKSNSVEEVESARIDLFDKYENLLSLVWNWDRNYILRAPISGKVSLFDYWSENQIVNQSDEVFIVVPEKSNEIIGKVFLPIQNSGKLRIGQRAIIKLDDYAFQEYGTLKGVVKNLSIVPRGNLYSVEIDVNNELKTSYGKKLDFRSEMRGNIEIITEDISLLNRVLYELIRRLNLNTSSNRNETLSQSELLILDESGEDIITSLQVEVATTRNEQTSGLSRRSFLGEKNGMLFLYKRSSVVNMWMKNTLIPLDIIFIDSNNRIVNIVRNTKPLSTKTISSKTAVKTVLEVNGGFCEKYNIRAGYSIAFK